MKILYQVILCSLYSLMSPDKVWNTKTVPNIIPQLLDIP